MALRRVDGVAVHDLLPAVSLLGDERGPLEHRDVLLHGGEAHVVAAGQRRDRLLALDRADEDVAPGRVRQRVEDRDRRRDRSEHLQPFGCTLAGRAIERKTTTTDAVMRAPGFSATVDSGEQPLIVRPRANLWED